MEADNGDATNEGVGDELENLADDVLRKEDVIDEIKEKLIINKKLKIDKTDYYSDLESLSLKELKTILFNLQIEEQRIMNSQFTPSLLMGLSNIIDGLLGDKELAEEIKGDEDLGNMVMQELQNMGVGILMSNPIIIAAKVLAYVFKSKYFKATVPGQQQQAPKPSGGRGSDGDGGDKGTSA
jgi:hypothetical protein